MIPYRFWSQCGEHLTPTSTDGLWHVLINHSSNKLLGSSPCVRRWPHLMVSYHSNQIMCSCHIHIQQRDIMSFILRRRKRRKKIKTLNQQQLAKRRKRQRRKKKKWRMKMRQMMICQEYQSLRILTLTCQRGENTSIMIKNGRHYKSSDMTKMKNVKQAHTQIAWKQFSAKETPITAKKKRNTTWNFWTWL